MKQDDIERMIREMEMNRDDIIRMAREADIDWHKHWDDEENRLERFAALVAKKEREECAKLCDALELANLYGVKECATAIRARGEK